MVSSFTALAAAAEVSPAGGAETTQIAIATGGAVLMTAALLWLGMGHRAGRVPLLGRVADGAGRLTGLPGWAALPIIVAAVSLVTADFGFYWDVSLHIDNGRDAGPLANPSHYFILGGLFGIFSAGWLAMVLPRGDERPGPAAVKVLRGWYAPVGGLVMISCAAFSLIGFPLDDVSHRLFGQDVTLWGPTHLMLLTGAAMTLVAILVLFAEGRAALESAGESGASAIGGPLPKRVEVLANTVVDALRLRRPVDRIVLPLARTLTQDVWVRKIRTVLACGGLLIGLSIYQAEFDFGVEQYRLLLQPVLIAVAAACALVAVRILVGRGSTFIVVGFYLLVRVVLLGIVAGVFNESVNHFPLYIAEAVIVEGVALAVSPKTRPYRFAIVAGVGIATVGVAAEWGWTHVWMPLEWPAHVVPEAMLRSLPVAVAGALLGAFLASALARDSARVVGRAPRYAAVASLLAIAVSIGALIPTTVPSGARGEITLVDAGSGPGREAVATVRFTPPDVADDADWLTTIAWQGGEPVRNIALRRIGPGVYRTVEPVPVDGSWKTVIRVHRGSMLASVPVFMPGDPAIPAAEVPAVARAERALTGDQKLLQRERKDDIPGWLWGVAGLVVLGISASLLALLGWGLVRLAATGAAPPEPSRTAASPRVSVPPRQPVGVS